MVKRILRPQFGYCHVVPGRFCWCGLLGQVLLVDRQQLRRRQRQEADDGVVQFARQLRDSRRRDAAVAGQQRPARTAHRASSAFRRARLQSARACTSSSRTPAARRASMSAPVQKPASVGRSCVVEETSACSGYSSCRRNSPALVLLEVEQAVAQNAETRQRLADRRLHGAQVLAHDDHLVAHALQRQDPHQVLACSSRT